MTSPCELSLQVHKQQLTMKISVRYNLLIQIRILSYFLGLVVASSERVTISKAVLRTGLKITHIQGVEVSK